MVCVVDKQWWWVEVFDGEQDVRLGACVVSAVDMDACWDEAVAQRCVPYGGPFVVSVRLLKFVPSSTVVNDWLSDDEATFVMGNWERLAEHGFDLSLVDFHSDDFVTPVSAS
jgi:hypothetical protein